MQKRTLATTLVHLSASSESSNPIKNSERSLEEVAREIRHLESHVKRLDALSTEEFSAGIGSEDYVLMYKTILISKHEQTLRELRAEQEELLIEVISKELNIPF